MSSLVGSFIAGLGENLFDHEDLEFLAAEIGNLIAVARAQWPAVAVDPDAYARTLGEKVAEHPGDRLGTLARLHAADLYLTQGCRDGHPAAISILHDQLLPEVIPALRHLGADEATVADVTQQMLEMLLVGDEQRPPRIAGYGGRGDLTSWLRSVAVRTALKVMARERRTSGSDDELDQLLIADDPALVHLKHRYAAELNQALRDALGSLSVRQRMLLRLHYLDGLTVDQLGRMYRVHRATAARWVAGARDALFEETRLRAIAAGVASAELTSVVRLVQSQIDLSLHRLLKD